MTVRQAADVMGLHVNTVRQMIARGDLTPLPRATIGRGSAPFQLDPAEVRRAMRARERRRTGRTPAEQAAYRRGLNAVRRGARA